MQAPAAYVVPAGASSAGAAGTSAGGAASVGATGVMPSDPSTTVTPLTEVDSTATAPGRYAETAFAAASWPAGYSMVVATRFVPELGSVEIGRASCRERV